MDFLNELHRLSQNTDENQDSLLTFFKVAVAENFVGSKTNCDKWIYALIDISTKIRSSLASFLLGKLIGNSLIETHYGPTVSAISNLDLSSNRELHILSYNIGFYSRLGLWRFLGFFSTISDLLECNTFWKMCTYMSEDSELSNDTLFLSNLLGIVGKSTGHAKDCQQLILFLKKCCYFSHDIIVNQTRNVLSIIKKVDVDLFNELFISIRESQTPKASPKLLKTISTIIDGPEHNSLIKDIQNLELDDNSFDLNNILGIMFCSLPAERQSMVKKLRVHSKKLRVELVENLCKYVNRFSSYSTQYMFLCFAELFTNSEAMLNKAYFLLRESSFSEVREMAFKILKHEDKLEKLIEPFPENYLEYFDSSITNVYPHILEGEINALILKFYRFDLQMLIVEFRRISSRIIDYALSENMSELICNGILFGCIKLSNRLIHEFGLGLLECEVNVSNLIEASGKIFESIANIVENNAPEGEDHEDFEFEIDNKSKTITHFGWKLTREVAYLLCYCVKFSKNAAKQISVVNLLRKKLLKFRHKGAICGLVDPFSISFQHIYKITSFRYIDEFCRETVDQALNNPSIDNARRSAGVPYLICAMFLSVDEGHLDHLMEYLLSRNYMGHSELNLIHFLNILKSLCKESKFSDLITRNIGKILDIAMFSMSTKSWKVVNASSMLIGCLVQIITSEFLVKRKMKLYDASLIDVHFPSVFRVIAQHRDLQEALSMPLLLLFRQALFDLFNSSHIHILEYIVNFLKTTSQSHNYYIRHLSSEILQNNSFIKDLMPKSLSSANYRHCILETTKMTAPNFYRGNGLQNIISSELAGDDYVLSIQMYPYNQVLLSELPEKVGFIPEDKLYKIFEFFLQNKTPHAYRGIILSAFCSYLSSTHDKTVIMKNPELLTYIRFLLVDDDDGNRNKFLQYWRSFTGDSFKTWIDALKKIYVSVASLDAESRDCALNNIFYKRLLEEFESLESESSSNGIFSPEPYNYNENVALEVYLARCQGIMFQIPKRVLEYYELFKDKPELKSCWMLLCVEQMKIEPPV